MIELYGEAERYALFADGSNAVVIDKLMNMVEEVGLLSDLLVLQPWNQDVQQADDIHSELAAGALSDLSVQTITASARMYTIPKGAQEEAKKALEWHKEHHRGGTPVGLNTARILANGGQIGLNKVRHIAKYFPRHEVDKKAPGYRPGHKNYPSNGRIAWALWGGDAAWKWAKQIVERENKAVSAGGFVSKNNEDIYENYGTDIDMFEMGRAYEGQPNAPEFAARVRLDGAGIDRLYMINQEGQAFVWDGAGWDDLGHSGSDIATFDRSLDHPHDTCEKHHILIDPESALIISARLQERPFTSVQVEDLDDYEAELVAAAADEIDWVLVDSTIIAAGEVLPPAPPTSATPDGYTPKERAANAKRQVRDKGGKFAKMGGRVSVGGDPTKTGSITRINQQTGTVTVKMDDGSTQEVPATQTEAYAPENVPTMVQQPEDPKTDQAPLDTSGILGQPRAPIDRPNATIPGGLPALGPADLQQIISDFPAWVASQRGKVQPANAPATPAGSTANGPKTVQAPGDNAPKHERSDYLKGLEKSSGHRLYDSAYDHPLLQNWLKKPGNSLWYSPITSAATTEKPEVDAEQKPVEGLGEPLTPETSDVQPLHIAVVSPDDPAAVMDLVAVIPASTNSTVPTTFKRVDGKWVQDEQIMSDLKSATPPPVVALNEEVYQDVLQQVDSVVTASAHLELSSIGKRLLELQTAEINPLLAEGGADRNRGNAEKLRHYWLYGRGALKIRWNTPGDWTRCYHHLIKYMGVRAKGYCALRHKEATGVWTGSKFNVGKRNIRSSAFTAFDVADEAQVIEQARLRAAIADAKNRVVVASGNGIETPMYGAKFVIPLVIPEDTETGDGRIFRKGSINTRTLPLPLLWQIKTGDGHDGSVVVGRIDHMERIDGGIGNAHGVFDYGAYGREAERLVREKFISGVSADLDKFEASEDKDEDENDDASSKKISNSKISVDKARVMAVTIVPKPAFEECKIYIAEDAGNQGPQEAEMANVPDGVYVDSVDELDANALVACGMIADAIPVVPPAEWFENPKLTGPTPLTVDDTGRVFGHIAAWHVDHIGMAFGTKPPRSKSNYAYFHTGVVRADNGKDYPVGQLTLSGGHASLEASAVEAARHYDDTGSAIADVHAGEDAHGIWVAGSLRPGAGPEQVRALRASAPSGDWRPIKGSLELVAVCQVNVPGFPIARARVASGQVYALVAAGAMTLAKMKTDPLQELSKRLEKLEEHAGLSTLDQIRALRNGSKDTPHVADLSAKAEALAIKMRAGIPYDELGYISTKTREKLAGEGKALPDGSYPIRDVAELKDAIQAYGRSKPSKRAAVRRHIMKRARALKKADLIPEGWKTAGLIDDNVVDDLQARVASARSTVETATSTPEVAVLKARVAAARAELANKSDDKKVWEKDNPKDESTPLTPAQKAAAKAAAKKAGRPYPNMIDNINAAKKDKKSAAAATDEVDIPKALADQALVAGSGTVIAEESDLAKALIDIAGKYGKFNEDDTGVWAGYTPASENKNSEIGVNCSNCILYAGGSECKILAMPVEPLGTCRFALIPDGLVGKK